MASRCTTLFSYHLLTRRPPQSYNSATTEEASSLKSENIKRYFESKVPGIRWSGNQGSACCPLHDDHRPSLSLNAEKGLFFCHRCRASGNLEEFKRRLSQCGAKVARKRINRLANRGGGSKLRPRIVTVYSYIGKKGKVVYQQARFEPKDFRFRRPDGKGSWIWNLQGVSKILYRLPEVIRAKQVYVVEGEKDVETLRKWGFVATCNAGGAGKWTQEYSKVLAGKNVFILQDNDEPGRKHALEVTQSVANYASTVTLVPCFPEGKDVTEWKERGGTKKKLLKLISNAEPFGVDGVAPKSPESNERAEITPNDWRARPLTGAWVIRLVESLFLDYLILPEGLPFVAALWAIGTRIFKSFDCFPYLTVTSPVKRCGKSRFAEILELLCANPLMSVNISEAALFRSVESDNPPTLFIDEAEPLRNRQSERATYLLAILQAGFREGTHVLRCVGRENTVKKFSVYCPKVVLAIGNLPDTLMDRSVIVRMRRHLQNESIARFRRRVAAQQALGVTSAIATWTEKNKALIAKAYLKQNLNFLRDREADIWEPLFTIASVAVPERLDELRQIALRLSGEKAELDVDESQGLRLLADIRAAFGNSKRNAITTSNLVAKLKGKLDSQWDDDLTPISLSRMLRPFGISSKQLWIDDSNYRGYERDDFKLVFERYLPPETR